MSAELEMDLSERVIRDQFIFLAQELSNRFPTLDLRFTLQSGTQKLRFMVASISREIIEMSMIDNSPLDVLYAAIFEIKERAQLFDD